MKDNIEDYINHVMVEKRLSKNTSNSYKEDLLKYQEYLNSKFIYKTSDISNKNITDYLEYLNESNYTITTITRKHTTIKNFYNYLYQKKIIKHNVAESIERPKIRKTLPKVLSIEEVDKLL